MASPQQRPDPGQRPRNDQGYSHVEPATRKGQPLSLLLVIIVVIIGALVYFIGHRHSGSSTNRTTPGNVSSPATNNQATPNSSAPR